MMHTGPCVTGPCDKCKQRKLKDKTHNISVVDDSDIIRRTFRVMLEHAGYSVTEFASGKEYLNSGLASRADCLLLDLEMPKPSGIDVLNAMDKLDCKMAGA